MWSFIARLVVLLLLASLAEPLPHARAQQMQQAAPTDQDMAAQLSRLIERWQKTDDPEEQIAALEAALRLEPQIRQWTLQASREQVRGTLLSALGDSNQKRRQGNRADNLEVAIKAYEAALTVRTREAFPQDWATTQNNLANAYYGRIKGSKADNLEAAIKAYEDALTVRTREAFPQDWALTQNNLAIAYSDRIKGSKADNLEAAIKAYEAALTVRTREAFPQQWASTQNNLATAYSDRIKGSKADNLEAAIKAYEDALTVRTREAFPQDWASTQNNLANAYSDRIKGSKADNLEAAIKAYEDALTVFTREAFPQQWAQTQNNLAIAYSDRIKGSKADNLEAAIKAYEAALTVFTREAFPQDWASTQMNLAAAYRDRIKGSKADNLETAINAYEDALTVRTSEAFPQDWAQTQNNLAIAYGDRIKGSKADNEEAAIKAYEAALTVRTREAFPQDWAQTQNNLANAYSDRIKGSKADNLETAIKAYEAALTVRTREAFPWDWAETQNNLAAAYRDRIKGSKADNLEAAIKAYEDVLTVRTRETFPQDWADTQNNLATAYYDRIKGSKADNLEAAIKAYEDALTVRTREAFLQDWASTQNNLAAAYRNRIKGSKADNLEAAIKAYEDALTVFTREAFPQDWASTQNNLANAYRDRIKGSKADNSEAAIKAYKDALTVLTREAFPRDHLRTGQLLGQSLLDKHDWGAAGAVYASARDAFLLLFGQGLDEDEAREVIAEAGPLFAESAYAAAEMGDAPGALNLLSEGRARLLAVALRQQSLHLPPEKLAQLTKLKAEIRDWTPRAEAKGEEGASALEHLVSLRQELGALLKEALANDPQTGGAMEQARSILVEGGAIVAPIITEVGGKLLIVTAKSNGPTITVLDLPKLTDHRLDQVMRGDVKSHIGGWLGDYQKNKQLEKLDSEIVVWEVLQQIGLKNDAELKAKQEEYGRVNQEWCGAVGAIGPELWDLFAGALDSALAAQGVKPGAQLVWLPTGALGLLPLGVAEDPQSKRRLVDTYEIVYAPSLQSLAVAKERLAKPAVASLAVIGNATSGLAFAEIEPNVVAAHFADAGKPVVELDKATPQAALAALQGKSYWHFASHGQFDWADARNSALVLSDGRLTVDDLIKAADLGALGQPRLVVLAACETGLYDIFYNPDEFTGLPGAFISLGADGVLSTLWPVVDDATMLLIAKFYDLHVGEGIAPPTALKRAQEWLRTASRETLIDYARDAAIKGKVDPAKWAKLEDYLRHPDKSVRLTCKGSEQADASATASQADSPPFSHPYYWSGFIYLGM